MRIPGTTIATNGVGGSGGCGSDCSCGGKKRGSCGCKGKKQGGRGCGEKKRGGCGEGNKVSSCGGCSKSKIGAFGGPGGSHGLSVGSGGSSWAGAGSYGGGYTNPDIPPPPGGGGSTKEEKTPKCISFRNVGGCYGVLSGNAQGFECTADGCKDSCKGTRRKVGRDAYVCTCSCSDEPPPPPPGTEQRLKPKVCGPDITKWLESELLTIAALSRKAIRRGSRSPAAKYVFLAKFGNSLKYGHGKPPGTQFTAPGSGCGDCPNTVTICGKCANATEVGNLALGAMGFGAGFPNGKSFLKDVIRGIKALNKNRDKADKIEPPNSPEDKAAIKEGFDAARSVAQGVYDPKKPGWLCASIGTSTGGMAALQTKKSKKCKPCGSSVTNALPTMPPSIPGTPPKPPTGGNHTKVIKNKYGHITKFVIPPRVSGPPPK